MFLDMPRAPLQRGCQFRTGSPLFFMGHEQPKRTVPLQGTGAGRMRLRRSRFSPPRLVFFCSLPLSVIVILLIFSRCFCSCCSCCTSMARTRTRTRSKSKSKSLKLAPFGSRSALRPGRRAPLRQASAARPPVSAEPLRVSGHAARV